MIRPAVSIVLGLAAGCLAGGFAAAAGGPGTAGGPALTLGGSARALGMGGAGAAALTEPAAIWVNPAQLARLEGPQLSFMHGRYVDDVALEQLAVAGPTPPVPGRFAGALTALRAGAIDAYDATGTSAGTYAPSEIALTGGWAMSRGLLAGGVAATWMTSQLADGVSAWALAADVGVSLAPVEGLTVGAAVQHLGSALGYAGTAAPLPMVVRGGAAWTRAALGLTLAADAVRPADGDLSVRAGAEEGFTVTRDVRALVRAGYGTAGPKGGTAGVTAGAGVHWRPAPTFDQSLDTLTGEKKWDVRGVVVEYAWTPLGELGAAHWFSIVLLF